jgi:putative transposase
MIDREHELSITCQAKLLGISRGSTYYLPQPVSDADLALMRRLYELHLERPFMRARMLRRQLQREGIQVGRCHVRTLMLRMGIKGENPNVFWANQPSS